MACRQNLVPLVTAEADRAGIPASVALAVAQVESGSCHWSSNGQVKVGGKGEIGVMQVMPSTAPGVNLYDVYTNIRVGVNLLAYLYRQFGDWSLAVAAYNCGERCVADTMAGKRQLPSTTAIYVRTVTGRLSTGASEAVYSSAIGQSLKADKGIAGTLWAALGISALAVAVLS